MSLLGQHVLKEQYLFSAVDNSRNTRLYVSTTIRQRTLGLSLLDIDFQKIQFSEIFTGGKSVTTIAPISPYDCYFSFLIKKKHKSIQCFHLECAIFLRVCIFSPLQKCFLTDVRMAFYRCFSDTFDLKSFFKCLSDVCAQIWCLKYRAFQMMLFHRHLGEVCMLTGVSQILHIVL